MEFPFNKTDALKSIRRDLEIAILQHHANAAPVVIIDEMNEAVFHISKAIDILEWDEE